MNPLSSLYGIVTSARNDLFDRGIFKSRKLSRPVISVGNISVGGSGKTPFVIMLGELLKQRGIAFDVLSRGYGRQTRGSMFVDPNGTSREFGDEPLLIARRAGCPVIVGESRYQAGKLVESNPQSQKDKHEDKHKDEHKDEHVGTAALGCPPGQRPGSLHILDDGFQHRSLFRDFDIVLVAADDLRDRLLPAGRLREPPISLRRADAIVLTDEINPGQLPANKNLWRVRRSLAVPSASPNLIAFCGIARPQRFIDQLQAIGIQPIAKKFYRDHHQYSAHDIEDLLRLRDHNHAHGFITTEKDAINLGAYLNQLSPVIARVEMELLEPASAINTILQVLNERSAKA